MASSSNVEFQCFVGGLNFATTDQSLEKAFSRYGKILESKISKDRETGISHGYGFITFKYEQSMKDAIKAMNGQTLEGCNIVVNKAQPGASRSPHMFIDEDTGRLKFIFNEHTVEFMKEWLNIVGPLKVHPNFIRLLGDDHGLDIIAMTEEEILKSKNE